MLFSYVRVVLAVWTLIRNYEALPSQGVSWSRSRSAVVLLSLPFLLLPLRATDVICACRWLRFLLLSSALRGTWPHESVCRARPPRFAGNQANWAAIVPLRRANRGPRCQCLLRWVGAPPLAVSFSSSSLFRMAPPLPVTITKLVVCLS